MTFIAATGYDKFNPWFAQGEDAITALAGGAKAGATALSPGFNRVSTAASAGDSVALPASATGLICIVVNDTANAISVYPSGSTDVINGLAASAAITQPAKSISHYICGTTGKWYVDSGSGGFSGSLPTGLAVDGISAAGNSQATGTQLTAAINTVSTVGAGAGVNLPASAAGLVITVINTGANPLLVYPLIGATDTINGIAATVGVSIFPGSVAQFTCTAAGKWNTQPASTRTTAFNTDATNNDFTVAAAKITGGTANVVLALTGALGAGKAITLPAVADILAAMHSPVIGSTYLLRIINESSGNFAWTVTSPGASITLTGTATIAQNTWRDFTVTVTSLTAITFQNAGTGSFS